MAPVARLIGGMGSVATVALLVRNYFWLWHASNGAKEMKGGSREGKSKPRMLENVVPAEKKGD